MKYHLFACVIATVLGLAPQVGLAETNRFDLKIRGLTLGEIVMSDKVTASTYSVAAQIKSTGLAAAIRRFSYTGKAQGRLRRGVPAPTRYEEVADTGRRTSESLIEYRSGVPVVLRYTSPKEAGADAPDPATQKGTVDPLTGVWALLRDVSPTRVCQMNLYMFDGKRRSQIALRPTSPANGLPRCAGFYERLQGFTAEEVSRHTRFDFIVTYGTAGDLLRVESVDFESSYGTAQIVRR